LTDFHGSQECSREDYGGSGEPQDGSHHVIIAQPASSNDSTPIVLQYEAPDSKTVGDV